MSDLDGLLKLIPIGVIAKKQDVASAAAKNHPDKNVTGELIKKILPLVAPIVISWVGSKFFGQKSAPSATDSHTFSGGGIGGLLCGLLGGSGGSSGQNILGGPLGGGKR
jgi:hypothetical protein